MLITLMPFIFLGKNDVLSNSVLRAKVSSTLLYGQFSQFIESVAFTHLYSVLKLRTKKTKKHTLMRLNWDDPYIRNYTVLLQ